MKGNYTPEQFVKDFLPDYEKRLNEYKKETGMQYMLARVLNISEAQEKHFSHENFPEALSACLVAQREACAKSLCSRNCNPPRCYTNLSDCCVSYNAVFNAPEPEPLNK